MLRAVERAGKRFVGSLLNTMLRAGRRAEIRGGDVRSVLIVRQHNQLGDMLCAVPLLRILRAGFPSARLTLVTGPANHDVMLHNRFVDEVVRFDKSPPRAVPSFLRRIRAGKFDLAIVPATVSTSFTSDMLARLSGAAVRVGCGTRDGARNPSAFCFNIPVDLDWRSDPTRHQARRNMDIVRGLVPLTEDLSSEITLTAEEREAGRAAVSAGRGNTACAVGFHAGAGKEPNRWPADRFACVAEVLAAEFAAAIFLTEGPMDAACVGAMERALSIPRHVIRNRPIRSVAGMLAAMDLVISNDTGIMHVAAAVGTPVLSLFGPTEPDQWAPAGVLHRFCRGRGGSIGTIPVEEVLRHAREMLRTRGSRVLA